MKSTIYSLAVLTLVLCGIACTKQTIDRPGETLPKGDVQAVIQASPASVNGGAANAMEAKATIDGLTFSWSEGDEIAVYQYGTGRNNTKNVFTYVSGTAFTGTIAGYDPSITANERYYVVYPASSVTTYGLTTGKPTAKVPAEQTGSIADLTDNVLCCGYQRKGASYTAETITSYDEESGILTFLVPFDMYMMTPVIKFYVPEELAVTNIVLTATDSSDNDVYIAGGIQFRIDASGNLTLQSSKTTAITLNRGGEVISGNVYVALMPDTCPSAGNFTSKATKLHLALTNSYDATASLELPVSTIANKKIKNLPALPDDIVWHQQSAPGISGAWVRGSTGGNAGNGGRFWLEAPEGVSLYYYDSASEDYVLADPTPDPANNTGKYFTNKSKNVYSVKTLKEHYDDTYETIWNWPFTSTSKTPEWFGKMLMGSGIENTEGASYTAYDLTYTITTAGSDYAYPRFKSASLMPEEGGKYSKGYFSITAPATGQARIMIQSAGSNKTVTVKRGSTTLASISLGSSAACKSSDYFDVTAGDVIDISYSGTAETYSLSYIWQTSDAVDAVACETFSGKTPYAL